MCHVEESGNLKKKMQTALHFMFARRQQLLNVSLLMLLLLFSRQQNVTPKYSWVCRCFGRNMGWFNYFWNNYSEEWFKKTFHISRSTFQFILSRIRHVLERDNTWRAYFTGMSAGNLSVLTCQRRLLLHYFGDDWTQSFHSVHDCKQGNKGNSGKLMGWMRDQTYAKVRRRV